MITEYVCDCLECRELCERVPCMGTPREIATIITKGYAYPNRLVVSTENDPTLDFTVVKPRGDRPTNPALGTCVFYENSKCVLHEAGLKPVEGRVAMHGKNTPRLLYHHLKRSWNTKLGRELIEFIAAESANAKNAHST